MKNKIKAYVDYQFRFDHTIDVEEKKAEIVANLYDRYDQLLEKYNDEEKAYIETIKQIGDFNIRQEEIPEEYSIKPSWPDIAMIVATVFAVFGLATTIFSLLYGSIMLAISISLYSASCFYLYNYSQYVKKVEMDVVKHNMLLKKIFQFMKTNFVFWSISISLIVSNLIQGVFSLIGGYGFVTITSLMGTNVQDILNTARGLIIVGIITLILSLIACYVIFKRLYNKLMQKYFYLTGEKTLKSHGQIAKEFLNIEEAKEKKTLSYYLNRFTVFIINLLTFSLAMSSTVNIHNIYINGSIEHNNVYGLNVLSLWDNSVFSIIANVLFVVITVINILMLIFRKKEILKTLAIFIQPLFLLCTLFALIFARVQVISVDPSYLILAFVIDIIFIVLYLVSKKDKKKVNKESIG